MVGGGSLDQAAEFMEHAQQANLVCPQVRMRQKTPAFFQRQGIFRPCGTLPRKQCLQAFLSQAAEILDLVGGISGLTGPAQFLQLRSDFFEEIPQRQTDAFNGTYQRIFGPAFAITGSANPAQNSASAPQP